MAVISQTSCKHEEEEYIDMEVSSSSSNFLCFSIGSPPQTREFEFQMSSSVSHDSEPTTSPADELFYKGKLLPLHLPPRLQMVQKLLQNSNTTIFQDKPPQTTSATPSPNPTSPLESCNISPAESCRVSSELNPDEYYIEWSAEENGFIGDNQKKSWSKKLKQIKQSSLITQKFKASRAYLKSLFRKSGCSDESCAKAACINVDSENGYMKVSKKNPFEGCQISSNIVDREIVEDGFNGHRRSSFSGAIQRHCATKSSFSPTSSSGSSSSSSSSFSFSSSGFYDLQLLKRSSSTNSEIESSIEGAIAHCKQSHQLLLTSKRNTVSEVGHCSLFASRINALCGHDHHERPGLRRSFFPN